MLTFDDEIIIDVVLQLGDSTTDVYISIDTNNIIAVNKN